MKIIEARFKEAVEIPAHLGPKGQQMLKKMSHFLGVGDVGIEMELSGDELRIVAGDVEVFTLRENIIQYAKAKMVQHIDPQQNAAWEQAAPSNIPSQATVIPKRGRRG